LKESTLLLRSVIVIQNRYTVGEKWVFVKTRQLKLADKKLDEDGHRLTKAYKLCLIKASNALTK